MLLKTDDIKDYEVEEIGSQLGSGEVGIDTSNMGLFYEMMSKSIYSDPIGSIVRELVSNGFDGHVKAVKQGLYGEDVHHPVIVKWGYEELDTYLSFQDFGSGIDEAGFHNVYLKYLSSDKRDSNDFMGAMGLGSKSPFSYVQQYSVITRVGGTEWYYIMSKGQNAKPNWDLLYKKETTEPNGTIVKFEVDYSDRYKFSEAIKQQLRYFDDVYVEGFDDIKNDYVILDYDTFKYRTDTKEVEMHLALGKVTYPIDWKMLKRPEINIPVGVKFEIGELMITPNREAIRYNDDFIKVINNRIDKCMKEIQSLAKTSVYDSVVDLITARNQEPEKFIRLTNDVKLRIYEGNYGRHKDGEPIRFPIDIPEPTIKALEGIPIRIPDEPFFMFRNVGFIINRLGYVSVKEDSRKNRNLPWYHKDVFNTLRSVKGLRTSDFKINKLKIGYLSTQIDRYAIVAKNNSIGQGMYGLKLKLRNQQKSPFTHRLMNAPLIEEGLNKSKIITLYKEAMIAEVLKLTESYDRYQVPQDYVDSVKIKAEARKVTGNEDILALDMYDFTREETSKKQIIKIKNLSKTLVVYATNKELKQAEAIYRMLIERRPLNKITVIVINMTDLPKMQEPNHIGVQAFLKHKVFLEQVTAYYLFERFDKLDIMWLKDYVPSVGKWYTELRDFMLRTINPMGYSRHQIINTASLKFVKELLRIAVEENLIIKEVENIMEALEFAQNDLNLIKIAAVYATTFEKKAEIAKFLISKGYPVSSMYTIKLTDKEKEYVDAYADYTSEEDYESSKENLIREVYEARSNKYSLIIPFTCHKNFPTFEPSKSVRISMLSLEMKPSLSKELVSS